MVWDMLARDEIMRLTLSFAFVFFFFLLRSQEQWGACGHLSLFISGLALCALMRWRVGKLEAVKVLEIVMMDGIRRR